MKSTIKQNNFAEQNKDADIPTIRKYIYLMIQNIDIYIKNLTAKKKETEIRGIPDDIDRQKLKKVWSKIYNCICIVKKDPKANEEYIILRGEHKDKVQTFLIEEGIGFKDHIIIHGEYI